MSYAVQLCAKLGKQQTWENTLQFYVFEECYVHTNISNTSKSLYKQCSSVHEQSEGATKGLFHTARPFFLVMA